MTATIITSPLYRVQVGHGCGFVAEQPVAPEPVRRPARVAVMLALAHQLQAQIAEGRVCDQAEVARRLDLTRARVSQLLRLLRLAPDLQEQVLFLESVDGQEPIVTERTLRKVTRERVWEAQRSALDQLLNTPRPTRVKRRARKFG